MTCAMQCGSLPAIFLPQIFFGCCGVGAHSAWAKVFGRCVIASTSTCPATPSTVEERPWFRRSFSISIKHLPKDAEGLCRCVAWTWRRVERIPFPAAAPLQCLGSCVLSATVEPCRSLQALRVLAHQLL